MSMKTIATVWHDRSFLKGATCLALGAVFFGGVARAAETNGLIAEWKLNEGRGDIAPDASGNGHDAKIFGAQWIKQGSGYALSFDGVSNYADCGKLGITGPVTIEAWIKPMRKGSGEANILGQDMHSFVLTYYNTEVCNFYIGQGSNSVRGQLALGEWKHVVASFDGKIMQMWINGRKEGEKESTVTSYQSDE